MIHVHLETRILPDQLSQLLHISTLDSIQHDAPPRKDQKRKPLVVSLKKERARKDKKKKERRKKEGKNSFGDNNQLNTNIKIK